MPAKSPIHLGVINPGADWNGGYHTALQRLGDRMRVVAVNDDIGVRTSQLADGLEARPRFGIRRLLADADVTAVLLIDPGWRRDWLLRTATSHAKPLLIAHPDRYSRSALGAASEVTHQQGVTAMPLLPLRWTPATIRLRELLATRMGPVQEVQVDLPRLCRTLDGCMRHTRRGL